MTLIAGLEDDPGVAEILAWACRDAGWEWRLLHGDPSDIDAIAALRPDVVTTGNRHPIVGGVELLRLLKEREETRGISVVFVTALDRESLRAAVRAIGLDPDADVAGYVQKPFVSSGLQAELRRVIEGARAALSVIMKPQERL